MPSKASEWADRAAELEAALLIRPQWTGRTYDKREALTAGVVSRVPTTGAARLDICTGGGSRVVSAETALSLARWIIETFGGDDD